MNCSRAFDFRLNDYATFEASCLMYDAVLNVVGGAAAPRLNCSLPEIKGPPESRICEWKHENPGNHSLGPHGPPPPRGRFRALGKRLS